jgi:hypothetical protein
MFKRQEDEVEKELDKQILQLLQLMENLTAYDEEYEKMANSVAKLVELRKKDTVSLETWVTVGTHLAGVFMILNHERAHVIASKTFGLLKKIV